MRKTVLPVVSLAALILWVACDSNPTQLATPVPSLDIGDAASDPGNYSNFYWLPPMVSQPMTMGTFDEGFLPVVKIEQIPDGGETPEVCRRPALWEFTRTSGPAGHRVGVDVHGQFYHLNWDTDAVVPNPEVTYRVSVCLGSERVGFADVVVDANGKNFRNLAQQEILGLVGGGTLPIKFRIESEIATPYNLNIVYHSNVLADPGECAYNLDVFKLDHARGVVLNLTNSPNTIDGTPSWSADGSKIVFASDRANNCGPPDLYIMNQDGTNVQFLTANGWKPAWSPHDPSWIAFQRGWPPEDPDEGPEGPEGRNHNIWIINIDTKQEVQLTDRGTDPSLDPYEDIDPTWHPVDNWVTFSRKRNAHVIGECPYTEFDPGTPPNPIPYCSFDVVSVDVTDLANPDALPWIRHTYDFLRDHIAPRWSPQRHGEYLVFQFGAENGNLWAIEGAPESWEEFWDLGLHPRTRMTNNPDGDDQNPSWGPNNELIFTSYRGLPGGGEGWGIYFVPEWTWLMPTLPSPPPPPAPGPPGLLVGGPGQVYGWAQFRPF